MIREATKEDFLYVAANLSRHLSVEWTTDTIDRVFTVSTYRWAGVYRGRALCVFGTIQPVLLIPEAHVWLAGTNEVEGHFRMFLRCNRTFIEFIRQRYSLIHCTVREDFLASRKWLRWLGFTEGSVSTCHIRTGQHSLINCTMKGSPR